MYVTVTVFTISDGWETAVGTAGTVGTICAVFEAVSTVAAVSTVSMPVCAVAIPV